MTWVTSRMGINVFLEGFFCLLRAGKGGGKFYGYMNMWIFIWVTDFNKLLTNFR